MALLLGIDLGTSYFKVGLFDAEGTMRGLGRVAVPKSTPAPGRSELGVGEFWRTLRTGLAEALAQADASASDIAGLSYSSQATTFLLLDRENAPLTPLIVWLDARGEPVSAEDAQFAQSEAFQRAIGFAGLSAQAAPAKWRWWQRCAPDVWRRAARVMTVADYFTFALTGECVGDASTAAFLALYDLAAGDWWAPALRHFGVETKQLSRPLRPGTTVGKTIHRATDLLGVPAGVAFAVGGLDHHVAAIGSGIGMLADASISTGTVLAALALVDAVEAKPGRFHGPHVGDGTFYRLAFEPAGAGELEDYQRRFAAELSMDELLALAARSDARGAGATLAERHGRAVRRMLERIATGHRELVGQIADLSRVRRVVATGGGARSPLLLQLDADALNRRVQTTTCAERACLGAALFAAVAAGHHATLGDAMRAMIRPAGTFEPRVTENR